MKKNKFTNLRSYEMQIKLPHAALSPKKTKNGDYSLLLRGDDFVWSLIIQEKNRAEAAKLAAAKFNSLRKSLKSIFPNLIPKLGDMLVLDDRYNEVVFADGNFKCCDWANRFLDEFTTERIISDSCGKLRKPTGKNIRTAPSVEWNHNSKKNRYIKPVRFTKTGIPNLWYDKERKQYVARIYYQRQKTVGTKSKIIIDVRKNSRTIKGRKLFAKGIIREIIKGKRIQERKYKEIRIKAKTLLQAKLKMIKIEKEYQNESPSDR